MRNYSPNVSRRFIQAIDRNEKLPEGAHAFESDYFELDKPFASGYTGKNISVSKVVVKGPTATAIVSFDRGDPGVKVSLIQEGGVWKIDKVKDGNVGLVK